MYKNTISKCITLVIVNHLYNIIIELVDKLILPIFSLFNKKINRFRINRIDLIEKIKNELIDKNENIWFHAASLGEYEIAVPIIKEIKKKYECNIVLTFFSESGFKLKKRIKEIDNTFYLPLDTKSNTKKFIDLINPKISIFIKSEIWPNYLKEIRKKDIKTYLLESRFKKDDWYFKIPFKEFMMKSLKTYTKIFTQDLQSEKVLKNIGIKEVINSGSLKIERVVDQLNKNNNNEIIKKYKGNNICIVCGSTWEKDEKIIFKYIKESKNNNIKWIIAPHNISKKNIGRITKKLDSEFLIYSKINDSNAHSNILILDTIGDLKSIYSYSDLSYIGGGMGYSGLHNILEACVYKTPVIIGKNYYGFIEAEELVELGGVVSIKDYDEFKIEFENLINNKEVIKNKTKIISDYFNSKLGALSIIQKEI